MNPTPDESATAMSIVIFSLFFFLVVWAIIFGNKGDDGDE